MCQKIFDTIEFPFNQIIVPEEIMSKSFNESAFNEHKKEDV